MTRHVVDQSIRLFRSIEFNKEIPIEVIEKTILPTIQKISNNPNIFNLFEAVRAKDDYTNEHNIGVSVLATLIGKWLKISGDDLANLSLAAILHDVGKVKIPMDLLHKEGTLTTVEYKLIQRHTVIGYQMLRETPGITHQIAAVAVADLFHAMSSNRPYHEPIPFHSIVKQMKQGIFSEFEPRIVSVFLKNITRKLVGTQVVLMDGKIGEIVYINPHDDLKPVIKVNNEFIDLSKERDLQIREIIC